MENVEILVPSRAAARVKDAVGSHPWARFASQPSHHSWPRVLIASLECLDTHEGRHELEELFTRIQSMHQVVVPIIYLCTVGVRHDHLAWQTFARLSHSVEREPFIAGELDAVRRIVFARRQGAEDDLIASATIDDDKLVVWNCEPRRFEVPVAELPVLAKMSADVRANFEVSQSGSRIRWPGADVDINLDTIREIADPELRREHEARARHEAARYARALRQLREEKGLKQSDIEGLTDRQVRRLEEGGTVPQIETLKKLAAAHGMSINDYLNELAKRTRKSSGRRPVRRARRTS
jgi:hypothetical protein